jgi:hypothetical protein
MQEQVKRKRGRPAKSESRAVESARPDRTPVDGATRGILTIHGKDPDYHYVFVCSKSEVGPEIRTYLDSGYVFARADEALEIGDSAVYQTSNVGSIIRVPEPTVEGWYNFLMKIPAHIIEERSRQKERDRRSKERGLLEPNERDFEYGKATLTYKRPQS